MKAAQITRYERRPRLAVTDIALPVPRDTEVLVRVAAAAVNPVDLLIGTGGVRLIQDYRMPLTLGNECAGVVERVGSAVRRVEPGDRVYARLPIDRIGAFAEYVAVDERAVARMPEGVGFVGAAAMPLTGLTAYQAIVEELGARSGQTVLITGGSGSFGEMAVPIARALGLHVVVTGNARARDRFLAMGAERYLDYRAENYWEVLEPVDHVIDTLGAGELAHELSVLKRGGRVVSLRTGPNRAFAQSHGVTGAKGLLFALAGARYDRAARRQGKGYRFVFVRADGAQLDAIGAIVEARKAEPLIDPHAFSLDEAPEALTLVASGRAEGKVVLRVDPSPA